MNLEMGCFKAAGIAARVLELKKPYFGSKELNWDLPCKAEEKVKELLVILHLHIGVYRLSSDERPGMDSMMRKAKR